MKIISTINGVLSQLKPFMLMVAMALGVMAAWVQLTEFIPFLRQIWVPRGTAQGMAIVAACLAIVAGRGQ